MCRKECSQPLVLERVDYVERFCCRIAREGDELGSLVEAHQCVRKPVRRLAKLCRPAVSGEFPSRRQESLNRRGCHGPEDEEERPLKPAAEPAQLEQRRGDDGRGGLHENVPSLRVCDLVREHTLELGRRQRNEKARAHGDGLSAAAAAGRERLRVRIADQVKPRSRHVRTCCEPLDGCHVERSFSLRERTRADETERHTVRVPVDRRSGQKAAEDEDRKEPITADRPPEGAEERACADEKEPSLDDVERGGRSQLSSSRSSSAKPRGGQSGSGASQRLVQWREAMF